MQIKTSIMSTSYW